MRQRIHHLLSNWDITWRRTTNVAQNKRHSEVVIEDFREYVIERVQMLGIKPSHVFNADQTNVKFSMPTNSTYANKGDNTVSTVGSDSSLRCSVMLGASWLGEKLPPFPICCVQGSEHAIRTCSEGN